MRAAEVGVVYSPERGAGFSGLVTCGSVWAEPVCSRKIAARRSMEIGAGLLQWQRQGGATALVTLTMRHNSGHRLREELDALLRSWSAVKRGRVWSKWLDRLGSPGVVRVVEITDGANGWHAHLHFALLLSGSTSATDLHAFTDWLFPKWHREVVRSGMPGALAQGQDARLVDGVTAAATLGGYLAKDPAESIGRELMGSWSKEARSEHSTQPVWRIAERFFETGEALLLDRWHEYERATKGRRQIAWSQGLRALLAVGEEATDEEVADEGAGDQAVVYLTREGWQTVLALAEPSSRLLSALDDGGVPGLRAYLDAHGVEYREA